MKKERLGVAIRLTDRVGHRSILGESGICPQRTAGMLFCGGRAAAPFGSMCRAQRSLCVSIYSAKKNRHRFCSACSVWGGRWDSNPRSSVPQTDALGQLRYTHHILARLKGLEPLAPCLEGRCSIQLSYRRLLIPQGHKQLERVMGIEPTRPAWKAGVLPLNYTRTYVTASIMIAHSRIPCQEPFCGFLPCFFIPAHTGGIEEKLNLPFFNDRWPNTLTNHTRKV